MWAHLINQMCPTQVSEVRSFLVVGQICSNSVDHDQHECSIGHVQPITATNKLVGCIPYEWTVQINGEVWLIEAWHWQHLS